MQSHCRGEMSDVESASGIVLRRGWLSRTPKSFQRAVLDHCRLRTFKKGEALYRAGDPPGGMFGLISGGVAIEIAPSERGPYIGGFATPGTWYGEVSAITSQPRRVGLVATRKSQLLHLSLTAIHQIVAEDPAAWRLIALVTVLQLDAVVTAYDDLMRRDHDKRLVAILLHLCGCRHSTPADFAPIDVDIGQDDLAGMSNIARTSAGTILRELEKAGHLERSYRCITVRSPDELRAMLTG